MAPSPQNNEDSYVQAPSDSEGVSPRHSAALQRLLPAAHSFVQVPPMRRTPTRRDHDVQQARSNLWEAVFRRYWGPIACGLGIGCLIGVAYMIFMSVVWVQAMIGCFRDNNYLKPCDQPMLKYYWMISTTNYVVQPRLEKAALRGQDNWTTSSLLMVAALRLPGFLLPLYGLYMVRNSRTCEATNHDLFQSTRNFIYVQCSVLAVTVTITFVSLCGIAVFSQRILAFLASVNDRLEPGCEEAVMTKLPVVHISSRDLIDPDDGQVRSCPVCVEQFTEAGGVIVRTPCDHYYHRLCLANWCKNHVTCPVCRAEVADVEMAPV